jgi:hypothetical protein
LFFILKEFRGKFSACKCAPSYSPCSTPTIHFLLKCIPEFLTKSHSVCIYITRESYYRQDLDW